MRWAVVGVDGGDRDVDRDPRPHRRRPALVGRLPRGAPPRHGLGGVVVPERAELAPPGRRRAPGRRRGRSARGTGSGAAGTRRAGQRGRAAPRQRTADSEAPRVDEQRARRSRGPVAARSGPSPPHRRRPRWSPPPTWAPRRARPARSARRRPPRARRRTRRRASGGARRRAGARSSCAPRVSSPGGQDGVDEHPRGRRGILLRGHAPAPRRAPCARARPTRRRARARRPRRGRRGTRSSTWSPTATPRPRRPRGGA